MSSSDSTKPAVEKLSAEVKKDLKKIPDTEWKKVLSPEEYDVCRQAGTEAPFTGKFDKHFSPGKYICGCCGAELFLSDSKFNSGCGWPAFSKSIDGDKNIVRIPDHSFGRERTEVRCKVCDAHLGHVFDDGPKDTGERYCINSVSIHFTPKAE